MSNQINQIGAWERQVVRRYRHPIFFFCSIPDEAEFAAARQRDQNELNAFHQQLSTIVADLGNATAVPALRSILRRIEHCYDQSCALAGNLTEQQAALHNLQKIILNTLQKSLAATDAEGQQHLTRRTADRSAQLERLQFPIVADLSRINSPIMQADIAAALLCETTPAIRAAAETFSERGLRRIVDEMRQIRIRCQSNPLRQQVERKTGIILKAAQTLAGHNQALTEPAA